MHGNSYQIGKLYFFLKAYIHAKAKYTHFSTDIYLAGSVSTY